MTDQRVASRYAKSLIDLALEKGILDEIYQDMVLFNNTAQQNRDFVLMLKNPIINHHKKNTILHQLFDGKVNASTMAIFDVITRKNREAILPSIASEFMSMYRQQKGIDKVVLTTSVPLTPEMRTKFEQTITAQTGKKVDLTEKIDPSLIGGFVLKIGDKQMDNSVKYKLKTLMHELSDDSYVKTF